MCTWIPFEQTGIAAQFPPGGSFGQCSYPDGSLGPPQFRYVSVVQSDGGGGGTVAAPSITPGQAAWQIARSIQFEPISIGMAPHVNPDLGHRRTYVGVPVWLWVADPTDLSFGTYRVSETHGGITISLTARVDRVEWDMGDGTTVTCGAGQAYVTSLGVTDSPTCGHRYAHTSKHEPGGMYTVTATSYWVVDWSGGGTSGTLRFELDASTQVEVRELQSVNVTDANGGTGG